MDGNKNDSITEHKMNKKKSNIIYTHNNNYYHLLCLLT